MIAMERMSSNTNITCSVVLTNLPMNANNMDVENVQVAPAIRL